MSPLGFLGRQYSEEERTGGGVLQMQIEDRCGLIAWQLGDLPPVPVSLLTPISFSLEQRLANPKKVLVVGMLTSAFLPQRGVRSFT